MRECLQEDYWVDAIHLQPTRADHWCVFSGDRIPEDTHAVSLQNRNYLVWLAVGAVDDFIRELERFDPDDPDERNKIAQPNRYRDVKVSYSDEAIGSSDCAVCGDRVGYRVPAYSLQKPSNSTAKVYVHRECREGLIAALERVWDYSAPLAEHV